MKDWKATRVAHDGTLRQAIQAIDSGSLQIALVVSDDGRLLGTVTDGDIRRAILRGIGFDSPVTEVMNTTPTVARFDDDASQLLADMREKQIHRIPLVDGNGVVVGMELLERLINPAEQDNWVVLMAGGLGSRLRPLTDGIPKPMLSVGNRPLLETILEGFAKQGFRRIFISVNYRAESITSYFGDGEKWGVRIEYLEEKDKLGTAGALSLLPEKPRSPFFVMNGDVLTKVNHRQLLDFHQEHKATGTMCVREYDFQVPYGVVRTDQQRITNIDEKPIHRFFVNAGIYVLEPPILDFVPGGKFFDMPTLFQAMIKNNLEVAAFPIREYWLDIGHIADYDRANGEFAKIFHDQ